MVRKILKSKDPVLRLKSKSVAPVDKKVKSLIQDLKDTLSVQIDPEGVGLAAPQIGKNLRIFIIKHDGVERIIINPEILLSKITRGLPRGHSAELSRSPKSRGEIMEGCLSLPNYYGAIKRNNYVKLKYINEDGKEIIEEFKDFFAQIVLHEIDHLDGIIFVDRLLGQKKPLFELKNGKWEEVELV